MRLLLEAVVSSGMNAVLKLQAPLQRPQMILKAFEAPESNTVLVSVNYEEKEVLAWVQEVVRRLENQNYPLWGRVLKIKSQIDGKKFWLV